MGAAAGITGGTAASRSFFATLEDVMSVVDTVLQLLDADPDIFLDGTVLGAAVLCRSTAVRYLQELGIRARCRYGALESD